MINFGKGVQHQHSRTSKIKRMIVDNFMTGFEKISQKRAKLEANTVNLNNSLSNDNITNRQS